MIRSFLILIESNVPMMRYFFLNEGMNIRMWIIKAAYIKRGVNNCFHQCLFCSKEQQKSQYSISYTCVRATYLKNGCAWEQLESQSRVPEPFSIEFSPSLAWSPWEKQWSSEDTPSFELEPSTASIKLSLFLSSSTPAHNNSKTHKLCEQLTENEWRIIHRNKYWR